MPNIYYPIQQTKLLGCSSDQFYRKYPIKKTNSPFLLLHGNVFFI